MEHFPLFLSLKGKSVLLVGKGEHISFKRKVLAPFCETVLSVPEPSELNQKNLTSSVAFVVADAPEKDCARIRRLCQRKHIPFCAIDKPELCDFFFPAILERSPLTVAVSTDGTSPAAAKLIKEKIAALLPPNVDEILLFLSETREGLKKDGVEAKRRSEVMRRLAAVVLEEGKIPEKETLDRLLDS